jgi:tetratricopeptide (TPR) repeat protein
MGSLDATSGTARRMGRNAACPCGSGLKFKRCCGAADAQGPNADGRRSLPAFTRTAAPQDRKESDRPNIDPWTAASRARTAAERFVKAQSGAPAGLLHQAGASLIKPERTPRRLLEAERYRNLGARDLEAGKFAAAVGALRRAIDLDPRDAEAHFLLGRALLRVGQLDEAADTLRLAIILKDGFAAAHRELAVVLAAASRDREALAACRSAVGLEPDLADGHRLLSKLLEAVGEIEEATASSRRAAALSSDTTAGRLDSVRGLRLEGDFDEAEMLLRQAIGVDPNSDELHKALGEVLATRGSFAAAIEACDRALALNPLQVTAHYTAVRARKCTEADRPRLMQMLSISRDPSINEEKRLFLHFAIGKLLDDLGEYREAMRHFDLANTIRGRNNQFDSAGLAQVIERLIERFTRGFFAARWEFGLEDDTPLLIVGMPRSGTTLVEQIVTSHPAIAAGEELFFWSNRASSRGIAEATALTPQAGRELAAEYLSLLRRIGPSAARVTDKQTFNFQQLGLIHLLLPNARIIHCRRHPIDTCLSMYFTFFKGRLPFVSRRADLAFAYRQYVRIMDHWRAVLPAERFLEVDYERLIVDRETISRRLVAFTGLDWHDACLQPERNRRTVTTASLWQARQPIFGTSVERWRHYEPWIGELRDLLLAEGNARRS